ncbi:MAG: hypothetical protein IT435_04975 [Phycisphaerales bacterium]|nr:hypothetical protein [Phycisphaerales bacterium]
MRIPLHKVYRAFPELDRFTDAECERYIAYILKSRGRGRLISLAVSAVGSLVVVVVSAPFLMFAARRLSNLLADTKWMPSGGMSVEITTVLLLVLSGALGIGWLVCGDVLLRRLLFARLKESRCPGCGYSLLGLAVLEQGRVLCPECGQYTYLSEQQLSREDLLAPGEGGKLPG